MSLDAIQHDLDKIVTETAGGTGLAGSRCGECGAVYFPVCDCCESCGSTELHAATLPLCGEVWSWTTQAYPPPSPPYLFVQERSNFEPYHVGYVGLGETLVLARLDYPRGKTPRIGDIVTLEWSLMATPDGELRIPVFRNGVSR